MQQIITDFRIQKINYTNSCNFPSYEQDENTPLLVNKTIINNLEDYQVSQGTITLAIGHDYTFNNVKYLYVHELESNLFTIDNMPSCCEFLFNYLSNTLSSPDFTISNPSLTLSIKLEYYLLAL